MHALQEAVPYHVDAVAGHRTGRRISGPAAADGPSSSGAQSGTTSHRVSRVLRQVLEFLPGVFVRMIVELCRL